MKLRIQGDSVRLRLTQAEVASLAGTDRVEDVVHVGRGCALTYALQTAETDALRADFEDGTLTVLIPRAWAAPWATSEQTGFEGLQDAGDGRRLTLLVEKDFACLHEGPDERDAFAHPLPDAAVVSDGA